MESSSQISEFFKLLSMADVELRADMKRDDALGRYHNLISTTNSLINEMARLEEQAAMHKGAAAMLRDIFQFTDVEIKTVPAKQVKLPPAPVTKPVVKKAKKA